MDVRVVVVAVVAVVSATTPAAARATRLVVGLEHPVARAEEERLAAANGVRLVRDIRPLREVQLSAPSAEAEAVVGRLRRTANVAFAAVDVTSQAPHQRMGPWLAGLARRPNDRGFRHQRALSSSTGPDIRAPRAWSRRTSCAKVAVIDSGIDLTHPDLRSNLWRNGREIAGNGIDDDHDGYVDDVYGVDLVRGHGSGADRNGHGTHVAGIIAARGNNRRGLAGVCWRAPMLAIRVLGADLTGRMSDAGAGIVYAVQHGAKIINASFGATENSPALDRAVAYARDHGALIVASAGNAGHDSATHPHYPSGLRTGNVLAVTATDDRDRLAPFANYGANVDLAAPGVGIPSTWLGGGYRLSSGTSMAAPFVTGAAAMLRAVRYPSATALRTILMASADPVPGLARRIAAGGRLNLDRALRRALARR